MTLFYLFNYFISCFYLKRVFSPITVETVNLRSQKLHLRCCDDCCQVHVMYAIAFVILSVTWRFVSRS